MPTINNQLKTTDTVRRTPSSFCMLASSTVRLLQRLPRNYINEKISKQIFQLRNKNQSSFIQDFRYYYSSSILIMPGDNPNNKRQRNNGQRRQNSRRNNNNSNKRPKQDAKDHHTRRPGTDFDDSRDDRDKPPHEGSFAFEGLRKQFNVSLEPRTVIGEDQTTLKRKVALLL